MGAVGALAFKVVAVEAVGVGDKSWLYWSVYKPWVGYVGFETGAVGVGLEQLALKLALSGLELELSALELELLALGN